VHGLSIPLGKLGFYLPRTLSQAFESTANDEPQAFRVQDRALVAAGALRDRRRRQTPGTSGQSTPVTVPSSEREVFRIGGTVIRNTSPNDPAQVESHRPSTPPATSAGRVIS